MFCWNGCFAKIINIKEIVFCKIYEILIYLNLEFKNNWAENFFYQFIEGKKAALHFILESKFVKICLKHSLTTNRNSVFNRGVKLITISNAL